MALTRQKSRIMIQLKDDGTPDTIMVSYRDVLGDLTSPEKTVEAAYANLGQAAKDAIDGVVQVVTARLDQVGLPDINK